MGFEHLKLYTHSHTYTNKQKRACSKLKLSNTAWKVLRLTTALRTFEC